MDKRIGRFMMVTFLLLFGLASMGAAASAKKEVVIIKPWFSEVTIGADQVGVIQWGWANCTKGLTTDWVSSTEQSWILKFNGEVIQTISAEDSGKYWGDPNNLGNQSALAFCAWPASYVWVAQWEYANLKLKSPGDYELVASISINQPLTDGFDGDENGEIDWYDGSLIENSITIHVLE